MEPIPLNPAAQVIFELLKCVEYKVPAQCDAAWAALAAHPELGDLMLRMLAMGAA